MRNNGVIKSYKSGTYRRKRRWQISGRKEREKKNGRLDAARTFNRLYTPWCNYEIHLCDRSRYVTCFDKDGKRELISIRILLDLWEKNVHRMRIRSLVGRANFRGGGFQKAEEKGKGTKSLGRGLFIESRAIEDGNGARPLCPCCTDVSSLFPLSFPPKEAKINCS